MSVTIGVIVFLHTTILNHDLTIDRFTNKNRGNHSSQSLWDADNPVPHSTQVEVIICSWSQARENVFEVSTIDFDFTLLIGRQIDARFETERSS